jgi:fucose 4-O-acetylase-like acetyltransferase
MEKRTTDNIRIRTIQILSSKVYKSEQNFRANLRIIRQIAIIINAISFIVKFAGKASSPMDHHMTKDTDRDVTLDIIKGIAIFLVVVGHSIQLGNGLDYLKSGAFYNDPLFKFIYSFHMPLFMLISGFLFGSSLERHSTKALLISRVTRLLIPMFAWTALTIAVRFIHHQELNFLTGVHLFILQFFTKLWFLWAIFWCSLIVMMVHRVFKDSVVVYLLIFAGTFFLPDNYNIGSYNFMYPFFVIGHLFKTKGQTILQRIALVNGWVMLGSLLFLYLLLLNFYNNQSYIYTSGYTILGKDAFHQIGIDLYRFLVGMAGCALVVFTLYRIPKKKALGWTALEKLGKASLGVYIVSVFMQNLQFVQSIPVMKNTAFAWAESVAIVTISYVIVRMLQRFNFTNAVFLGGR